MNLVLDIRDSDCHSLSASWIVWQKISGYLFCCIVTVSVTVSDHSLQPFTLQHKLLDIIILNWRPASITFLLKHEGSGLLITCFLGSSQIMSKLPRLSLFDFWDFLYFPLHSFLSFLVFFLLVLPCKVQHNIQLHEGGWGKADKERRGRKKKEKILVVKYFDFLITFL